MKKYNIINNTMGWLVFLVAAVTYLLTIEPTASFWDCPEFISQGYKLEIGHPPGNPMFILAARFAANFAGGDVTLVSKCVNAMSALLSAATILLLFWSITHLVKKLVVKKDDDNLTLAQYLVIMGSGVCGALAYTWSDTFWFSAVEAEVYAFSSFCTALVFWLILKWENRADKASSDRYLILIAYVFGFSLGVHLLNLLAIPAIALIFYYRKTSESTAKGSLLTLLISFVVIVLILYGLEPGFIELAGYFELFFVNTLHLGYNSGVLFYAVLLLAAMAWTLWELHRDKSETLKRVSFLLAVLLSGMLFLGDSLFIPIILIVALAIYLFKWQKRLSPRIYSNIVLSMMMIFIGFSCYGLVLIRSGANLPLDENSPNSPFALSGYLSRDQYGKSPLIYGYTLNSPVVRNEDDGKPVMKSGPHKYTRVVKTEEGQPNEYVDLGPQETPTYSPETEMLFPRIHSSAHASQYASLLGEDQVGQEVAATDYVDKSGNSIHTSPVYKPTMNENLQFFFSYQLNYMYWRYFMWNFAGRQNDMQSNGPGDPTRGNWISGIPFIDNPRLGDQRFLPDDYGKGNKGHNVFFMLPLLMGIIGLLWQAFEGKKGIEQFWVVFFLFFMTGIAIVMYLNQTPSQPRERDYAYAGSFYAYAIWIGMGVAALWRGCMALINRKKKEENDNDNAMQHGGGIATVAAAVVALIGIAVPLQMVSQTWDDHDRSGRYCARDFGENYLQSVDKDGIIFCNGDNDTFPLWYLQEVEGVRTDVRAVNLSYLATDWYIAQMQRAAYDSKPLPMKADATTYAYDKRVFGYVIEGISSPEAVSVDELLNNYYNDKTYRNNKFGEPVFSNQFIEIPTNARQAVAQNVIPPAMLEQAVDSLPITLPNGLSASQTMILDLLSSSIAQGWKRPVYFASTIPESMFLGLSSFMQSTGMAYQVTPVYSEPTTNGEMPCNTAKMYDIVMKKFKWGGLVKNNKPQDLYLDETVTRMVTTTRSAILALANSLCDEATATDNDATAKQKYQMAFNVLKKMDSELPTSVSPYQMGHGLYIAHAYYNIGAGGNINEATQRAKAIVESQLQRFAQYAIYYEYLVENGMDDRISDYDIAMVRMIPQLFDLYRNLDPQGINKMINVFKSVKLGGRSVSDHFVKELTMTREEIEMLERARPEDYVQPSADAQFSADTGSENLIDQFIN